MQNNICPECKTENEPEYKFCKNCGTPIQAQASEPKSLNELQPDNSAFKGQEQPVGAQIDGVPIEKVITFVGKNAQKIVPKFVKLQEKNTKVEWCWPPFIWGFFLGPVGVAIWFFYRKMYKKAFLFSGIGILINYISAFVKAAFNTGGGAASTVENYIKSFFDTGKFDAQGILSAVTNQDVVISNLFNSLVNAVSLACAIVVGLLGLYFYKKHTITKIKRYTPVSNDPNYINIGLAASGGTSPGAAILGAIAVSFVSSIPDIVQAILELSKAVYGL